MQRLVCQQTLLELDALRDGKPVETISQQVLDVVVLLGADASDTAKSGRCNFPEATIRRPKKKSDKLQLTRQTHKSCLSRFDSAAYNLLQFLLAVSLSMGAHVGAFIFTARQHSLLCRALS